jgi:phosphate transport system permease protein
MKYRQIKQKSLEFLCHSIVMILFLVIIYLLSYLFYRGYSSLNSTLFIGDLTWKEVIFDKMPVWDGIWPATMGTLSLVVLTMLIAIIPGIGCGIFLACYASPIFKKNILTIINVLAGIPSIVMGLFGFLIILLMRQWVSPDANTNLILSACCLAILVLPVIIISTQEAIKNIPSSIRMSLLSLGLSQHQIIRSFYLPLASRGILSGIILAIGRAAEDTAVIMLTGVVANSGLPATVFDKFEALPFHIYIVSAEYQSQLELSQGFSTAIVLLLLSVFLFMLASIIEWWYRSYWHNAKNI